MLIATNRQVLEKETQHGGCVYIQEISDVVTVTQQGLKALLWGFMGDLNIALLLQAVFRRAITITRGALEGWLSS